MQERAEAQEYGVSCWRPRLLRTMLGALRSVEVGVAEPVQDSYQCCQRQNQEQCAKRESAALLPLYVPPLTLR